MIKVCLTHDVDRISKSYQYFTKPCSALKAGNISLFFKRICSVFTSKKPYWGFDTVIDIENKYQVKSTFFFLNESIKLDLFHLSRWPLALGRYKFSDQRVRNMIRRLDQNGWEIGLHGSYNSYKDVNLLIKEKQELEDIVGHSVIGIRQHYLNMDESTWIYQQQAGFLYDSTWGSTKDWGFVDNRSCSFFPFENSLFCEIPMIIMDSTFVGKRENWKNLEQVLHLLEKNNGYLVVNFHTNGYDEIDYPCNKSTYCQLIEVLLAKKAKFLTMTEAYNEVINFKKDKL